MPSQSRCVCARNTQNLFRYQKTKTLKDPVDSVPVPKALEMNADSDVLMMNPSSFDRVIIVWNQAPSSLTDA